MSSRPWLLAAVASVVGIVAGLLVPSPLYLMGWMFWPAGVHSTETETESLLRMLVIYGGGALFWGWVVYAFLARRRRHDT